MHTILDILYSFCNPFYLKQILKELIAEILNKQW